MIYQHSGGTTSLGERHSLSGPTGDVPSTLFWNPKENEPGTRLHIAENLYFKSSHIRRQRSDVLSASRKRMRASLLSSRPIKCM